MLAVDMPNFMGTSPINNIGVPPKKGAAFDSKKTAIPLHSILEIRWFYNGAYE